MEIERKFWVARDESDELRMYTSKPTWMPDTQDLGNGVFMSEHPNWQIDVESFREVAKGEAKLVKFALIKKS